MNDARTLPPSAAAAQLLLCMIWGLGQVATKVGNTGISPIWQAALRSIGATLLLVAWIAWRRIPLGDRSETLVPGIVAGVLFGLEFVFLFVGLVYTTAVRAVLLLYSAPFFVALGAHWFVPGDRFTHPEPTGNTQSNSCHRVSTRSMDARRDTKTPRLEPPTISRS